MGVFDEPNYREAVLDVVKRWDMGPEQAQDILDALDEAIMRGRSEEMAMMGLGPGAVSAPNGQREPREGPPEPSDEGRFEWVPTHMFRTGLEIKWKQLRPDASVPVYAYPDDLGFDLACAETVTLAPGESRDVSVGLAAEPPPGYGIRITGRSSTLRKRGLFVNEGVIDGGYRGELFAYVTNRNAVAVEVQAGDRLAQGILTPVVQAAHKVVDELSPTLRGTAGFGSTGVSGGLNTRPARPLLYAGGPIDYADRSSHDWRHLDLWAGFDVFCPVCENNGEEAPSEVVRRNMEALNRAEYAVFDLSSFSIGTPIEAWHAMGEEDPLRPKVVALVHPQDRRGVFVQIMADRGARVVPTFEAAARRLATAKLMRQQGGAQRGST